MKEPSSCRNRRPAGDRELEVYRSIVEEPTEFRKGFTWVAVAGAWFCGLLMMPAAIYLSLMTGGGIAAAWVTLIIFTEVSRRAMRTLSRQELVILLAVAGGMAGGGPIAGLIWRQFFVQSDAVRDIGLMGKFPSWWAPPPGSAALTGRSLLHRDWMVPILLMVFMHAIGSIKNYTLSYFFFRLTSDVEKLPFPFAGIHAQGSMALAESGERKTSWKWRLFAVGAVLGLAFGALQVGVPLVTGAMLVKPIRVIPLPWYDATVLTERWLPATPTGVVIDLGLVLTGMVIPFWAAMGTAAAIGLTLVMNPLLYRAGVLTRWQPGMDTVSTTFSNSVDFWMSFGLGVTGGLAVIGVYQTVRDLLVKGREVRARRRAQASVANVWAVPPGRGDFSPWLALAVYAVCASLVVWVCHRLVPGFPVLFLFVFTFLYTPLISYINARLIGICGQQVHIPFVREAAYILSGYRGVEIWLAPIPIENLGGEVQSFRAHELTGTNFFSYVKATALVVPMSFFLSFLFWGFIWKSGAIPSDLYPHAQKMWELQARNTVLLYSATLDTEGAKPLFFQALHPSVIAGAFLFALAGFTVLSLLKLPVMAIYGFVQGVGQMPHGFVPVVVGALVGRLYLRRRLGETRFLRIMPVMAAGYGTGVGLVALLGVAVNLIVNAVSALPF